MDEPVEIPNWQSVLIAWDENLRAVALKISQEANEQNTPEVSA